MLNRRVYLDLGVNWGTTLRLYSELVQKAIQRNPDIETILSQKHHPWEIYGFEAHPLIQPFDEQFIRYLNGERQRPGAPIPPAGSHFHLTYYAAKCGCWDGEPVLHYDPAVHESAARRLEKRALKIRFKEMDRCMAKKFKKNLQSMHPDESLLQRSFVASRLNEAKTAPKSGIARFTFIPAAVGSEDGLALMPNVFEFQGIFAGGAHLANDTFERTLRHNRSAAISKTSDINTIDVFRNDSSYELLGPANHKEAIEVVRVDLVSWLVKNFSRDDFIVVKMDIEGSEHKVLDKLIEEGAADFIDVLAWECHSLDANICQNLERRVKDSGILLLEERDAYDGWDQYSSPETYPVLC